MRQAVAANSGRADGLELALAGLPGHPLSRSPVPDFAVTPWLSFIALISPGLCAMMSVTGSNRWRIEVQGGREGLLRVWLW